MNQRELTPVDRLLVEVDGMLKTLSRKGASAMRPSPAAGHSDSKLSDKERKHSAGLMRVNHTGEVCAQALYQGQAMTAKSVGTRREMQEGLDEVRRHALVLHEAVRDDIRILAEHVAGLGHRSA